MVVFFARRTPAPTRCRDTCRETLAKSEYEAKKRGTQGLWRPKKFWTDLGFADADVDVAPQKPASKGVGESTKLYKLKLEFSEPAISL